MTSKNIGYTVPIKTTERKYIINQLFTSMDVSLLNQKKLFEILFSSLWKKINTKIDKKIKQNKNISINNPLSGSFAKVCTEFKIPDLTKNVPHILNVNVEIERTITHEVRTNLFSRTKIQ